MTNPRLGCESHPDILKSNHVKGQSSLKELLAQLTDTVARIAQDVEEVRQENEELKGRLVNAKSKDKSWSMPFGLCNEIPIEPPASNIVCTDMHLKVENTMEPVTITLDDPTDTSEIQEGPENKLTDSSLPMPSSSSSDLTTLAVVDNPGDVTIDHMTDAHGRVSLSKGCLNHLQEFDMKRAWKDHPEFFNTVFKPSPSNFTFVRLMTRDLDVKESSSCLNVIIMDPSSTKRSFWNLASVLLLMFDLIFVPVDISFDVNESQFTKTMELIALIFWTVDIPLNFLTALQNLEVLDKRLSHIAGSYLRTWFFFDLFLVTTEFASLILENSLAAMTSILRVARWGRLSRLLRLVRVARLAKLRPLMRQITHKFHLSKSYIELTHGLLGQTILFVASAHILACLWHVFGQLFDDSWVQANHLESTGVGQRYAVSLHWTFSRLLLTRSRHNIQSTPELILDACLMFLSFIMSAFYLGMVTSLAITKANSHPLNVWKASVAFSQRYQLSKPLQTRVNHVLEASHYLGAAEIAAEEQMFLRSIPESLKKDLIFESRVHLLTKKQFFMDMVDYNKQVVVAICNNAVSSHVVVSTEVLFECGDAGNAMYINLSGILFYQSRGQTCSELPKGSVVSEIVLWTDTEHLGELMAIEESRVLTLDTLEFANVVTEHKEAYMHAVRYAKHFVWRLNTQPQVDDLTEIEDLDLDAINAELFEGTSMDHFVFISHYKIESGTEATLLRDLMDSALRENQSHHANLLKAPIFIDSEDLIDLAMLKQHVLNSDILMILLTPGIFSRPWCLLEMVTAVRNNQILVPVEVQRPGSQYRYPDEEFYKNILDGKYLHDDAVALLASEGVSLEEVESTIRQVFRKISLSFSPHKTKVIREAEVSNILKRCEAEFS